MSKGHQESYWLCCLSYSSCLLPFWIRGKHLFVLTPDFSSISTCQATFKEASETQEPGLQDRGFSGGRGRPPLIGLSPEPSAGVTNPQADAVGRGHGPLTQVRSPQRPGSGGGAAGNTPALAETLRQAPGATRGDTRATAGSAGSTPASASAGERAPAASQSLPAAHSLQPRGKAGGALLSPDGAEFTRGLGSPSAVALHPRTTLRHRGTGARISPFRPGNGHGSCSKRHEGRSAITYGQNVGTVSIPFPDDGPCLTRVPGRSLGQLPLPRRSPRPTGLKRHVPL